MITSRIIRTSPALYKSHLVYMYQGYNNLLKSVSKIGSSHFTFYIHQRNWSKICMLSMVFANARFWNHNNICNCAIVAMNQSHKFPYILDIIWGYKKPKKVLCHSKPTHLIHPGTLPCQDTLIRKDYKHIGCQPLRLSWLLPKNPRSGGKVKYNWGRSINRELVGNAEKS